MQAAHPPWLYQVLQLDPRRIWNLFSKAAEREDQRIAHAARSRDTVEYDLDDEESTNPFSVRVGSDPEHARKNRYGIEAYDRTRVFVNGDPSRYVNANWVRERTGGRWWVAAEAPTVTGVHAFLSLLLPLESDPPFAPRIHTIVQLNPRSEGSLYPPEPYFPLILTQSRTFHAERGCLLPDLEVKTLKQKRIPDAHCTRTHFSIVRRHSDRHSAHAPVIEEAYEVVHLHFETWPEKSVPNSEGAKALLQFMHLVEEINVRPYAMASGKSPTSVDPPILVHCSNGGRMGVFLAIASLMRAYKCLSSPYDAVHASPPPPTSPLGPLPPELASDPVMSEIDHLRDQRPGLVGNETQARFIYQMLWNAITERSLPAAHKGETRMKTQPSPQPGSAELSRTSSRVSTSNMPPRNHRRGLSFGDMWSAIRGR